MMTEQRKGEIALMLLKHRMLKEGFRLSDKAKREVHSTAKRLGLDPAEAMEFAEILTREIVDEVFARKTS